MSGAVSLRSVFTNKRYVYSYSWHSPAFSRLKEMTKFTYISTVTIRSISVDDQQLLKYNTNNTKKAVIVRNKRPRDHASGCSNSPQICGESLPISANLIFFRRVLLSWQSLSLSTLGAGADARHLGRR